MVALLMRSNHFMFKISSNNSVFCFLELDGCLNSKDRGLGGLGTHYKHLNAHDNQDPNGYLGC